MHKNYSKPGEKSIRGIKTIIHIVHDGLVSYRRRSGTAMPPAEKREEGSEPSLALGNLVAALFCGVCCCVLTLAAADRALCFARVFRFPVAPNPPALKFRYFGQLQFD